MGEAMTRRKTFEELLEGRASRRAKEEDRWATRMERRWKEAGEQIGELCRDGKTVFYVYPVGGKYREGSRNELEDFLLRNRYA